MKDNAYNPNIISAMHITKSYNVPISVKGIVFDKGRVWLRKNERTEWELPGGKLDKGEQPEQTVVRELKEELGFEVIVQCIISTHLYTIKRSTDESHGVLVVIYLCKLLKKSGDFEFVGEVGKTKFNSFTPKGVPKLDMPQFYKKAIKQARKL